MFPPFQVRIVPDFGARIKARMDSNHVGYGDSVNGVGVRQEQRPTFPYIEDRGRVGFPKHDDQTPILSSAVEHSHSSDGATNDQAREPITACADGRQWGSAARPDPLGTRGAWVFVLGLVSAVDESWSWRKVGARRHARRAASMTRLHTPRLGAKLARMIQRVQDSRGEL